MQKNKTLKSNEDEWDFLDELIGDLEAEELDSKIFKPKKH